MIPPVKPSRPEVEPYDDLIWAWSAFWRLSASRPIISMVGPARIPPSDIFAYAQMMGWSPEKQRDFLFYADAMDAKFMEIAHEEQEKEADRKERERKAKQRK